MNTNSKYPGCAARMFVTTLAVLFLTVTGARAQSMGPTYKSALGLKVWGDGAGVSYKQFVRGQNAIEGVGYFWNSGARFVGLYEFHFPLGNPTTVSGLTWYVGPGAHLGIYSGRYFDERYTPPNDAGSYAGIDGVIGLDYKFTGAPINLSLDWQPAFEFGPRQRFIASWGGLGVRYTF